MKAISFVTLCDIVHIVRIMAKFFFFFFFFFFLRDFIFKKTLFEKLQYLKEEQ